MKKLLILFLACLPLMGTAKEKNDNSDPKYLAGAITMNDGKIEFTKEVSQKGLNPYRGLPGIAELGERTVCLKRQTAQSGGLCR